MKKLTLIILIVAPLKIFSQTLTEVVNIALEYNAQLKASHTLTQSAEMEKISEQRSHLPSVSLKASYVHNTVVPEFNIPIPGFNQTVTLNPHDIYETGIHLDYVLFSGFAQSQAAKVKAFEQSIATVNEDQEKKNIAFKTVQAYRNGQLMKLSLGILDDTRRRNIVQMNKVKALLENGMALQLDTLSLSLNHTMIEQQIIESRSVLQNWFQVLEMLTGKKISLAETSEINDKPLTSIPPILDFEF